MRRWAIAAVLILTAGDPASAQDLVTRLQNARVRRIAADAARNSGMRLVPRKTDPLGIPSDSIRAWIESMHAPPQEEPQVAALPYVVDSVRVISQSEWDAYSPEINTIDWAFVKGQRLSELDTLRTGDLRARLQAVLGDPTRTLAELDSVATLPRESIIEFEYWMIVNDSLPVVLIDVNGPLERGLVLATAADERDRLPAIHEGLRAFLFREERRAPFIDYFFNADTREWFVTGFDGASFFHQRIERPSEGRPVLDAYLKDLPDR